MKLLTIIIPTYNMEAYLDRCLGSLVMTDSELMSQLEVLVVNDGSKDGSMVIAQRYAGQYPATYRIIDKENGNYGSCINRGLAEATGQYIKVLDADDWFITAHLAEMMRLMAAHEVDAVISAYDMVGRKENDPVPIRYNLPENEEFALGRMDDVTMRQVTMHAVAYRTEMVRAIGYRQSEGMSYTDQEWIFLPMAHARKLIHYGKPVYQYRIGREGQTVNGKVWERNFWMELKGMRVMLDEYHRIAETLEADAQRYLEQRLSFRNYAIYEAYFTKFRTTDNNDLMRQYDQQLATLHPGLYQTAGCYSVFGLHYVRWWRGHNFAAHIPWLWLMSWLGNTKKDLKARYKHYRAKHNS